MESYPGCCCIWLVPKEELQSAPMRRMSFLLFLFTQLARFSKNSFQSDSELVDVGAYADIRKIEFVLEVHNLIAIIRGPKSL